MRIWKKIAKFIGWPENLKTKDNFINIIPRSYIESVIELDMNEDAQSRRDKNKMTMLLRSLARNESTIVGNQTLLRDIKENESVSDLLSTRETVNEYLDILNRLYLIYQEAYSINYRSPKRHFTDPSLACASLGLRVNKLMSDFNTFGFMFESLVERDLRIYMDYLDGHL